MSLRQSAFWMKQLDERILEHIQANGWATPRLMAQASHFTASRGHIRERCQMLHYVRFIEPIYGDAYDLTTDGQMFLDGEIDARYRPWPTVERVLSG
jgi:hypothetical protein